MDLNDVAVFVQVVRAGSFTGAARELDMQKSSVSRKVSALEERLSTRLLQRTTRKLHLTDEGRTFFEYAERAVSAIDEAQLALLGMHAAPRGLLRITAPLNFGFLGPIVAAFLQANPDVEIEMSCSDRVVDLVDERFDLAIRAGPLPDSALIARRLGSLPKSLFASPAYLAREGTPTTPEALASHACLAFGASKRASFVLLGQAARREISFVPRLVANDYDLLRAATLAGLGIALLPTPDCERALRDGELEILLPEWSSEETPLHAVYPSTLHLSTAVRAFVDHLIEEMPKYTEPDRSPPVAPPPS